MKTKRTAKQVRTAKAAPAVNPAPPVNPVPPPAPPPELDIEPWKVVTTQSKPKHVMGRVVITITSRLQYRGRTMAALTGPASATTLQAMANQNNATGRIPTTHKKAYADVPEGTRRALAVKPCNQGNIMQPFEP